MKIIYCIPRYSGSGGTERTVLNKANYLADILGYEVIIISTEKENSNSFYNWSPKIKLISLNIDYRKYENSNLFIKFISIYIKNRLYKNKLTGYVLSLKPDIVVSVFWYDFQFLYKLKDGSKKILEFHFTRFYKKLENSSFLRNIYLVYAHWRERKIALKYHKFVLLTERDKSIWEYPVNSTVIPNMCTFESTNKATLKNKRAICFGRLAHQKGFDILINIWKDVSIQYPEWKLDIFGDGEEEYKKYLAGLIKSKELTSIVSIHPSTNNVEDEYLSSSIYLMTSRYEGLPMVLIEAMALGLPIVAFDCDCGPSDLIENGKTGFVAKVGNAEEWKAYVIKLIRSEAYRKTIGAQAQGDIIKLSPQNIMPKWVDVFMS